jgi:NAD(P)-dependent dehydrogenase (short-subunit alcohol dehydrogenase family)
VNAKTYLLTGANSGLGLAVAGRLAELGGHVILVCRDEAKAGAAAQRIRERTPGASLDLEVCDLASMASVRALVERVHATYPTLDVLINNAAVMTRRYEQTADGLERMWQVNYVAPAALTLALLDVLQAASPARVINIALPPETLRLDGDGAFPASRAFFRSKLALLLFSLELGQRVAPDGVTVTCVDPGPGKFRSGLIREMPAAVRWIIDAASHGVERPADNIVRHATSKDLAPGTVFAGMRPRGLAPYWQDADVRANLVAELSGVLRQGGFAQTTMP